MPGVKLPLKRSIFIKLYPSSEACKLRSRSLPRHSNILLSIWVKCLDAWGKIMKPAVFIKAHPTPNARMLLSNILPQTSKKITQIYLPDLWHFATLGFQDGFLSNGLSATDTFRRNQYPYSNVIYLGVGPLKKDTLYIELWIAACTMCTMWTKCTMTYCTLYGGEGKSF